MKYILLVAPFLAATAWAQAEDVYKTLSLGDRVQITFRSSATITGQLVRSRIGQPPKPSTPGAEETLDYGKEGAVTVDLSWEYPGLDGTMTVLKKEIKEIKKLQSLDKETLERLKTQKAEIKRELERQNAQNKADSERRAKEAEEERLKLAEKARKDADLSGQETDVTSKLKRLEEGLKLLREFPPEAGWGPEKLKDVAEKGRRKQPVTPQESRFLENFQLWSEAKGAQDEAIKSTKKGAPPEEKKP